MSFVQKTVDMLQSTTTLLSLKISPQKVGIEQPFVVPSMLHLIQETIRGGLMTSLI
jgi:hypothetical protein